MVRKNEYPRKTDFSKDGVQGSEPAASNFPQKTGEFHHKENITRNNRPPRETQQRDNNQQKEYQRRETPKRETTSRDNQLRDNVQRENAPRENTLRENTPRVNTSKENIPRVNTPRENTPRENTPRENTTKDNLQKNNHRENTQNRDGYRDNREPYRQHNQRPAIKPQTEENLDDISADIGRIEKEIELELKEIRSMRLGI